MHCRPRFKQRRNTRLNSGSLQAGAKVGHQFVLTAGFGHGRSMGLGPAERDRATRNAGNVRGQIIDRDHLRRHTIEKLLGEGAFSLLGLVRCLRARG
jgi:hypothetical protein